MERVLDFRLRRSDASLASTNCMTLGRILNLSILRYKMRTQEALGQLDGTVDRVLSLESRRPELKN